MSLGDDDEDYDISNQVLNNYLFQFTDDSNFEQSPLVENDQEANFNDMLQEFDKETHLISDSHVASFFYDPNQIDQSLSAQSNISEMDKNDVLNIQLSLLNKVSRSEQSYIKIIQDVIVSNMILGFIFGTVLGISVLQTNSYFIASMATSILALIVLSLIRFKAEIIRKTLDPIALKVESYLVSIKQLMYYLKEIEMVNRVEYFIF